MKNLKAQLEAQVMQRQKDTTQKKHISVSGRLDGSNCSTNGVGQYPPQSRLYYYDEEDERDEDRVEDASLPLQSSITTHVMSSEESQR